MGSASSEISAASDEEPPPGLHSLPEVELNALSQMDRNPLGAKALVIRPADWKHGESEHFIYHFIHTYVATPISVEAEFHFRVIAQELGLETLPGAAEKSHIYIFEKADDWQTFRSTLVSHHGPSVYTRAAAYSSFAIRRTSLRTTRWVMKSHTCSSSVSISARFHAGWMRDSPSMFPASLARVTSAPATTMPGPVRTQFRPTASFRCRN
jgi:hypothetical protein